MDGRPATGRRIHFRKNVLTTPVLLVPETARGCCFIYNEGATDIRVGASGTVLAGGPGLLVRQYQSFTDEHSMDDWWAAVASGSGTVCGYFVV